jgi:hypothetical protein
MRPKRRFDGKHNEVFYTIKYSQILHRECGPALIRYDGKEKYWARFGKFHRVDGPAKIYEDGTLEWYIHGLLHREDGPAVIFPDGAEQWYKNGKLHREDGPAVIWKNKSESWYLKGIPYSKEAWFNLLNEDQKVNMMYSEYFVN